MILSLNYMGQYKAKLNDFFKEFLKNGYVDDNYNLRPIGKHADPSVIIDILSKIPTRWNEPLFYEIPVINRLSNNISICKRFASAFFLGFILCLLGYIFYK